MRALSRVVLPAPLGPMTATSDRGGTTNETSGQDRPIVRITMSRWRQKSRSSGESARYRRRETSNVAVPMRTVDPSNSGVAVALARPGGRSAVLLYSPQQADRRQGPGPPDSDESSTVGVEV